MMIINLGLNLNCEEVRVNSIRLFMHNYFICHIRRDK